MRDIRYQAAVVDGARVLLIEVRTPDGRQFELLPGGGREEGETPEACVTREVREEVQLDVTVERLLYDMAAEPPDGTYTRWRTYLCRIQSGGDPQLGHEEWAELTAIRWFDLEDPQAWSPAIGANRYLHGQLVRIQEALGLISPVKSVPGGAVT